MKSNYLITTLLLGKWFIDHRVDIETSEIIDKILNREFAGHTSILSDNKPFAFSLEGNGNQSSISTIPEDIPENSTAIYTISGTMLKYGTMCSYGTMEIASAIREAAAHKKIGSIILNIDSGGGAVDAIAPLVEVIQLAQANGKPVIASCDLCASAAYFVASYCDEIHANNNISAEFGSIGVMMSFRDYQKKYEKDGITEHRIYSNLSEFKNEPLELALQGKYDMIKTEMLDPLAQKFQDVVKENMPGLNSEVKGILSGKTFYAQSAMDNGMINAIGDLNFSFQRARKIKQQRLINNYTNT